MNFSFNTLVRRTHLYLQQNLKCRQTPLYRVLLTSSSPFTTASPPIDDIQETPAIYRLERTNETLETKRARLLYQSRKRGILETDLILSTFAQKELSTMSLQQLDEYDRLLDENDWDIYYWVTEKKEIPEKFNNETHILQKIKVHAQNKNRVVLRMPDLQ